MGVDCSCGATLLNTGSPSCPPLASVLRHLLITRKLANDGTNNSLTIATLDKATIQAAFDAANPNDRIFPLQDIENVSNERADTVFQEFSSGKMSKVRKGFKRFTGFIPGAPYQLLDNIKSFGCSDIGAYALDKDGNFVYRKDSDDTAEAFPILIDKATWDAKYVEATDEEVAGIMITFQWKASMKDEDLRIVPQSSLDFDETDVYGLLDVDGDFSVATQTTTTITVALATVDYDDPVEGLVTADFVSSDTGTTGQVYNVTADADIAVTVAETTTAGTYELTGTFPTGNVIRLDVSKSRYDFSPLSDGTNDVTIP